MKNREAAPRSPVIASSRSNGGWRRVNEFCALDGEATFLWPRWLVLRAVGIVFVLIFLGIVDESNALVGPTGIMPLSQYFTDLRKLLPGKIEGFLGAPSVFWLGTSAALIATVAWAGLLAAVALVCNVWPRVALVVCWAAFLSFVATWGQFSPAQIDRLMLETALLCIPFAPPGVRPGLGAASPPRRIAVFMLRWLLFRVMLESGLVKLFSTDPLWRNFTALDLFYETSPAPTRLGYWAHQLPHAAHVAAIGFTFLAELVAPLAAVCGGRRGRWFALGCWSALQVGIQLTCNFGWLNLAAFGLGLLLLDDQMIAGAIQRWGRGGAGGFLAARGAVVALTAGSAWRTHGLRAALAVHFALTLYYFAAVFQVPGEEPPLPAVVKPFAEFRSANHYILYAHFEPARRQLDFEGSNDGGKTWRTFEYRHVPQQVDRAPEFFAPRFARFETTVELLGAKATATPLLPLVAAHLLARTPDVLRLFARDPFPDRPPTVVRMRRYRLAFTDPETLRHTRCYWTKEFEQDLSPVLHLTEEGGIEAFSLAAADAALRAGNVAAAVAIYDRQFHLGDLEAGFRLADLHARGAIPLARPEQAFALYADLAARGEVRALHNLGICHEFGLGVAADVAKAAEFYRRAAEQGRAPAMFALGLLHASDRVTPRDDVAGLAWLLRAEVRAKDDAAFATFIREDQPAAVRQLSGRMSAVDIAAARARAGGR